MRRQIEAAAAQAELDALLDQVERGDTVVITREGKPIARLVPDHGHRQQEIKRAMAGIKELRKHTGRATTEEILAWRDEGRR